MCAIKFKFLFLICISLFLINCGRDDSAYSNEFSGISFVENAKILPSPPGEVNTSALSNNVIIKWKGTQDDTVRCYIIYKKCDKMSWENIGKVNIKGNNRGEYQFVDKSNVACQYAVSSKNVYGKEGPKSTETNN